MRQLLQGLHRLASSGGLPLLWGCPCASSALLPACAAAQVQLRWLSGAAGGSAPADAGMQPCGAAERAPLQDSDSHLRRQASGAAALISDSLWGSERRGMHSRAAGDATAPEHAGAAPAGPIGTMLAASAVSQRHSMHTGVPASAAAAEPAPAHADVAATGSASQPHLTPGTVQNPPMPPWTPTRQLVKRKVLTKRMGFMIQTLEQEAYEKAKRERNFPDFSSGDVVELKLALPENQRRTVPVRGVVIAVRNRGIRTSFTLLNNITGGGNIERTFPLFCPTIQELKVVQKQRIKARRSKLYYLRDRKASEFKV